MINFPWLFTITIVSTLSIVVRCEPETKLTLDDHMKDTSQHCLELGFQIFDKLGLPDLEKSASSREIISFLFAKYRPEDPYFSVLSNDSLGFLLDYYGTICSDLIIKHQLNHVKPTDHVKESWSNFDIEPSPIEPAKALPKGATVEPEIDDLREIEVADVVDQQLEPNIKLADEEEEPKSDQHEAGAKVDVLSDKDDAIADAEPQPEPNQVAKEIVVENPNASILSRVVNRSAARTTGAISEPASSTGVGIENVSNRHIYCCDF